MNRSDWRDIEEAANLLGLGAAATLGEIRRAYHRLSKLHHPDVAGPSPEHAEKMLRLSAAYERLRTYCEGYRFPLTPPAETDPGELYDPQDWWRTRFGQEPLWDTTTHRKR